MTTSLTTHRMTRPMLLIAVGLVSISFALWGAERAVAAAIGAAVGLVNWFALRWLTERLVAGAHRAAVSMLMMGKIGLLIAIVFVLINRLAIDPVGLAFGLGVLFVGPLVAGLLAAQGTGPTGSLDPSAAHAAQEER